MAPASDTPLDLASLQRVTIERSATGGEGVGRLDDGIVVFVSDAVPGDDVMISLTERKKKFARGEVQSVLTPGPSRVTPECDHVEEGCGGCDWQHVRPEDQLVHKAAIVTDTLQRVGRLGGAIAVPDLPLPMTGHRTSVRAVVSDGRAGFRRRRSHEPVMIDSCLTAHPLIEELLIDGRFGTADEVVIRVGARTGERLVMVSPTVSGISLPDDVLVVGADEVEAGVDAWYHEEVAGHIWRISARSFFQTRPDGAERLIDLAGEALITAPDGPLVDLYSGVGLFAGSLGGERPVTAVESSASSVADARVNIGDRSAIIESKVERWTPRPAAALIADPARAGLGRDGVAAIAQTGASVVALVSCDAGALGRDAGLLDGAGYKWRSTTVVDLFPQTSHIEAVSVFHLDR